MRSFSGRAPLGSRPVGFERLVRGNGDHRSCQSPATAPIGTRRCRLFDGEACGPGTNHTGFGVGIYRMALPGNGGTPSGDVPLLRSDGCQHASRAHMPPSRRAAKPASAPSTFKRLSIRHHVESGAPFNAGRNLLMGSVIKRGGLRDATSSEYRNKAILLDVTHANPQARVHMRDGSNDRGGSAVPTSEARNRNHYARVGQVFFDERSHKLVTLSLEFFFTSRKGRWRTHRLVGGEHRRRNRRGVLTQKRCL